ncbi:MAG: hypothetical protein KatS3mg077_2178 [Candidatus Binatia bacterium]|nr:MAG: hypothetical protein KatS3mg077_2178 [Candidatus Binatia bacterium]
MATKFVVAAIAVVALLVGVVGNLWAETLVAWNNLGMHCMDGDYSVFALLPPYNTIHAQLVDSSGRSVRNPKGWSVTYQAIADPTGSINTTAAGKTNFWDFAPALFGVHLPPDVGLAGVRLPGRANEPQPLRFDPEHNWFVAEGIPVVPYDDEGKKNTYPVFLVVARDSGGSVRATASVVAPVSDEMDCRACHASGSSPAAQPRDGWVYDPDPQRDMRWNVLRLHDDREGMNPVFRAALVQAGYAEEGLYATARAGTAILCARCHASAALPGSGLDGVSPLTQAVHRRMAWVQDPDTLEPLASGNNRAACYRCHPGKTTRCLRGAMGNAVASDGSRAIQCQSCHGGMLDVAAPSRRGWLDEPNCQSCHTGSATRNAGGLRFLSVFDATGAPRQPVDLTFATNPDVPAPGTSLYRFSTGHGGLACQACHGPTHAEYPSSHANDNLQTLALQGHVGVLSECGACHARVPMVASGGPHGLHPVGQAWVPAHGDFAEHGQVESCRTCHGADYRGTVLSRALADRTLAAGKFGTKVFWRGFQVGCYACHNGPNSESPASNRPPVVEDVDVSVAPGGTGASAVSAYDPDQDALALRIVEQPSHGTAWVEGTVCRYAPEDGFRGEDRFTFAAWDGAVDSNLGVARGQVRGSPCTGDCNGDGEVTVDEIVVQVRIALSEAPVEACNAADLDGNAVVTIEEIVRSVAAALAGCAPASQQLARNQR